MHIRDSSGANADMGYYCTFCSITSYPDDNTRRKGKLTTRTELPEEPAVTLLPERGLKSKTNTPKGTFRKLQERGIKITNYHERGWRKQNEE
ncbi:MAG TPA: hypothetical protein VIX38_01195 [Nitrososphaeraceae archaeon]